ALLLSELESATLARTPRLVTVLGDAGVGKTRLLEELDARASPEARVLRGRCLSYGRGITFWPLVEMVREAAGIHEEDTPERAGARVRELTGDDEITARVASAVGLTTAQFTVDDLFWGARKLFEHLALERPLVVVVEDLHWAELTFIDLVEHLAAALDGAALIVCAARHELVDVRPEWSQQHIRIELEPLSAEASAHVVADLLDGAELA